MKINQSILLCIVLSLSFITWGQDDFLCQEIELPPVTLSRTLPNGFTYILKKNTIPKDKVEVRLCLKVGSNQELEGEEGLAHFIEHLAFDGSKIYPDNEAVSFWESLGCKFGNTINAYTGYDRTVYTLSLPTNHSFQNLKKTIAILSDWLTSLELKEKDIVKQKKIIHEEISSYSISDEFAAIKKGNCPHLLRMPMGTVSELEKINSHRLKEFYRKWYTPSNAALIIVGNIDIERTEKSIQESFGNIPNRGEKTPEWEEITYPQESMFFSKKNRESRYAKLSWMFPCLYKSKKTLADIVRQQQEKFVLELVSKHMHSKKVPISISKYWYLQKTALLDISISEKKGITEVLGRGVAVIEGMKQKGFTQKQIDVFLPNFIEKIKSVGLEKESEVWSNNFIEMFLFEERPLASKEDRLKLISLLENTNLASWNKILREVFSFTSPSLTTYSYNPQYHKALQKEQLQKVFAKGVNTPDTSYVSFSKQTTAKVAAPESLLQDIFFHEDMIKEEKYFKQLGVHYVKLSNGVSLYLKPTQSESKLDLSIVAKGGLSLLPSTKYKQMEDIISYVHLGGIKDLKGQEFQNFLLQENISYINTNEDYFHGCMASAPSEKAKVLCNLVYNKLCSPELCYTDFEEIKQSNIKELKSKKEGGKQENSMRKMSLRLEELRGNITKLSLKDKNIVDIEKCNLDSLYAFYKENFIQANKLACVATGKFNIDSLKQYLAGTFYKLACGSDFNKKPSSHLPLRIAEEQIEEVEKGRLYFNMLYYGNYKKGLRGSLVLKLMRDAIRSRLLIELRERQGLIYSPYIELTYRTIPSSEFYFNISGTSKSEHCRRIEASIYNIIQSLQTQPIGEEELQKMKHAFLVAKKSHLSDYKSNNWRDYLLNTVKYENSLEEIESYEDILEEITVTELLFSFQTMLKNKHKVYLYAGECLTQ